MRSPSEILFRLRQEGANFALFLKPPRLDDAGLISLPPLNGLPDPQGVAAGLKGSDYEQRLCALAEQILRNKLPLLGHEVVDLNEKIAWRRDPHSGLESPLQYFRRVPYLDARQVGDQKMVWEFNRHAHMVVLAQAWRLTGDERYTRHLFEQLEGWWRDNPFQQGINWTAALEVAFRALSWIWVYHLIADAMPAAFRARFLTELYRHGHHLAVNLSVYSSPNTHLLGEAVALHAIGRLFPQFPYAAAWRRQGAAVVQGHMESSVLADGMYFEQTTYYHVYALDMFLFHQLIETTSDSYRARLEQMARLAASIAGPARRMPFLGDDDGGRFFHPYGARAAFVRGSLAVAGHLLKIDLGKIAQEDHDEMAAWWLGPAAVSNSDQKLESAYWSNSGLVSMTAGEAHVLVDAGPFGAGTAGHSHADTLSLVVRDGKRDLLIDPGTYCYLSDPAQREWFRSTAAHNTICVDSRSQATPVHAFRWTDVPKAEVMAWNSGAVIDSLQARCSYRGLVHNRQVVFFKELRLVCVLDEVEGNGESMEHEVEQFWHMGSGLGRAVLLSTAPVGQIDFTDGWISPALGVKQLGRVIRVRQHCPLPVVLGAVLDLDGVNQAALLEQHDGDWCMKLSSGLQIRLGGSPCVESGV